VVDEELHLARTAPTLIFLVEFDFTGLGLKSPPFSKTLVCQTLVAKQPKHPRDGKWPK
jgi:hypothetical protein